MTGAIIAIAFGICLLFIAWTRRDSRSEKRLSQRFGGKRIVKTSSRPIKPQHPHLERKLLKLLSGNRNTANRLIQQSQLRYPDKSADWHWEKAIYDLERDRWR
jgi:hypothetical protein